MQPRAAEDAAPPTLRVGGVTTTSLALFIITRRHSTRVANGSDRCSITWFIVTTSNESSGNPACSSGPG